MKNKKFFCKGCRRYFDSPKIYEERHGLEYPPYERVAVCPRCESEDFYEFDWCIEKIEVAEKILPAIMQLNRYCNALIDIFGDKISNSDLSDAVGLLQEMIFEMFGHMDIDCEKMILKMDNTGDMRRILMYLEGEL